MTTQISKHIFYPLWDIKDRSIKLQTLTELESSQWNSFEEVKYTQLMKLTKILQYAYDNCSFYRNSFDIHGVNLQHLAVPEDLSKIPILTKKHIQEETLSLLSSRFNKGVLISAKTGGSTGKALRLYFDKQCEEMRNAAAMRSDRWAGWDLGMKRAALWGNPPVADTWKKKLRNVLLDRVIYLDTMNLNNDTMGGFVCRYRSYKPEIIFGHSHSIYIFSRFIQKKGITDIRPKGIVSTSMMLMPNERQVIEEVFQCKVTNRYGCEELGLIACECEEHKGMHLNIDHLYVEFIKEDGTPAKPGEEGSIVVTDLINYGMPLIRYKVEDVGVPSDRRCPCGRGFPLMDRVAGRLADFLVRKDGSLVAGVSLVERTLTAIKGIEQMQIVQEAIDQIVLNLVKGADFTSKSESQVLCELQSVFGKDVQFTTNYMNQIPQESSGKYRFSICRVSYS